MKTLILFSLSSWGGYMIIDGTQKQFGAPIACIVSGICILIGTVVIARATKD